MPDSEFLSEMPPATLPARKELACPWSRGAPLCSLTLMGTEDEVIAAAYDHAILVHQQKGGAVLRDRLRTMVNEGAGQG